MPTHLQRRNTSENIKYNSHYCNSEISSHGLPRRRPFLKAPDDQHSATVADYLPEPAACITLCPAMSHCSGGELRAELWPNWEQLSCGSTLAIVTCENCTAQHSGLLFTNGVSVTRDYSLTSSSFWESWEKLRFQLHLSLGLGTVRQIASSKEKDKKEYKASWIQKSIQGNVSFR